MICQNGETSFLRAANDQWRNELLWFHLSAHRKRTKMRSFSQIIFLLIRSFYIVHFNSIAFLSFTAYNYIAQYHLLLTASLKNPYDVLQAVELYMMCNTQSNLFSSVVCVIQCPIANWVCWFVMNTWLYISVSFIPLWQNRWEVLVYSLLSIDTEPVGLSQKPDTITKIFPFHVCEKK